jgi:translation initiation factor 2D
MFKKSFAVQAQNLLSKKDLKSLKSQICEEYPALEQKAIDDLLPDGQVKMLKLDTRGILYVQGDLPPVFFDPEGRGEIYPTLHTLWLYPDMMAELTVHDGVSKFVLKGADLMLPGVIEPANGVAGFGSVTKGQKRCVKTQENPYPIAVGKMLVNQTQLEKMKGKGLEPMHIFKDALWEFSGKGIPNAGFSEKEDEVAKCSDRSYVPGAPPTATPANATDAEASPKADNATLPSAALADDGASPTAEASPIAGGVSPSAASDASPKAGGNTPSGGGSVRPAEDWSQDELLDFCFLQAFTVSLVDDKSLPVEASELYEKHMKPSRPEGTTLDVKKSSHKQIGKFLNAHRKAKVIDVTEKKGVISVTKVVRDHKFFVQAQEKFAGAAAVAAASNATASTEKAQVAEGLPAPIVKVAWMPQKATEGLFKKMGKSKSELYSWEEVSDMLVAYIKQEELGSGAEAPVKLNEELITALWRVAGGQKKDLTFPEQVEFSELLEKMEDRMKQHTVIEVAATGKAIRTGPPEASLIEVSLSRKGAHNVTKIEHLEAYSINVTAMGDDVKRKFSCTVNIEEAQAKNSKDKVLIVQGHVDKELEGYLKEKFGITKDFLSVKR